MNAVDTNVLVYAVDLDEPVKRAKANELLDRLGAEGTETILPWQVAAEFLGCLRRWEREAKIDRTATLEYLLKWLRTLLPSLGLPVSFRQ